MSIELMQFLASHRRNYPRGFSFTPTAMPYAVAFYSENALTPEETDLVKNAAEKGLKLLPAQYVITTDAQIETRSMVVLGTQKIDTKAPVIQTYTPAQILASADVKRAFWEDIKVLASKH